MLGLCSQGGRAPGSALVICQDGKQKGQAKAVPGSPLSVPTLGQATKNISTSTEYKPSLKILRGTAQWRAQCGLRFDFVCLLRCVSQKRPVLLDCFTLSTVGARNSADAAFCFFSLFK